MKSVLAMWEELKDVVALCGDSGCDLGTAFRKIGFDLSEISFESCCIQLFFFLKKFILLSGWKCLNTSTQQYVVPADLSLNPRCIRYDDLRVFAPAEATWRSWGVSSSQDIPSDGTLTSIMEAVGASGSLGISTFDLGKKIKMGKVYTSLDRLLSFQLVVKCQIQVSTDSQPEYDSERTNPGLSRTTFIVLRRFASSFQPPVGYFEYANFHQVRNVITLIIQLLVACKCQALEFSFFVRLFGITGKELSAFRLHIIQYLKKSTSTGSSAASCLTFFRAPRVRSHAKRHLGVWWVGLRPGCTIRAIPAEYTFEVEPSESSAACCGKDAQEEEDEEERIVDEEDQDEVESSDPTGLRCLFNSCGVEQASWHISQSSAGLTSVELAKEMGMKKKRSFRFCVDLVKELKFLSRKSSSGKSLSYKIYAPLAVDGREDLGKTPEIRTATQSLQVDNKVKSTMGRLSANLDLMGHREMRVQLVLDALLEAGGLDTEVNIRKFVRKAESEYSKTEMDRKTLQRLLETMLQQGTLVKLTARMSTNSTILYALGSIDSPESRVKAYCERVAEEEIAQAAAAAESLASKAKIRKRKKSSSTTVGEVGLGVDSPADSSCQLTSETAKQTNEKKTPRKQKKRKELDSSNANEGSVDSAMGVELSGGGRTLPTNSNSGKKKKQKKDSVPLTVEAIESTGPIDLEWSQSQDFHLLASHLRNIAFGFQQSVPTCYSKYLIRTVQSVESTGVDCSQQSPPKNLIAHPLFRLRPAAYFSFPPHLTQSELLVSLQSLRNRAKKRLAHLLQSFGCPAQLFASLFVQARNYTNDMVTSDLLMHFNDNMSISESDFGSPSLSLLHDLAFTKAIQVYSDMSVSSRCDGLISLCNFPNSVLAMVHTQLYITGWLTRFDSLEEAADPEILDHNFRFTKQFWNQFRGQFTNLFDSLSVCHVPPNYRSDCVSSQSLITFRSDQRRSTDGVCERMDDFGFALAHWLVSDLASIQFFVNNSPLVSCSQIPETSDNYEKEITIAVTDGAVQEMGLLGPSINRLNLNCLLSSALFNISAGVTSPQFDHCLSLTENIECNVAMVKNRNLDESMSVDVGAGDSAGMSVDVGAGESAGMSVDVGAGDSAGMSVDVGAGDSAGGNMSVDVGAGDSAGMSVDVGAGDSAGMSVDVGAGDSAGGIVSVDVGAGDSAGGNVSVDVSAGDNANNQLDNEDPATMFVLETVRMAGVLGISTPALLELWISTCIQPHYSNQTLSSCLENCVKNRKIIQFRIRKRKSDRECLNPYLTFRGDEYLSQENDMIEINYSYQFKETLCSDTRPDQAVPLLPWISHSGSTNELFLQRLKSKVLSELSARPGLNLRSITMSVPVLSSEQTLRLLELMEQEGAIACYRPRMTVKLNSLFEEFPPRTCSQTQTTYFVKL